MNWKKVAFGLKEEEERVLDQYFRNSTNRSEHSVAAALSASIVLGSLAKALAFGDEDGRQS